jgi:hypothetical protein
MKRIFSVISIVLVLCGSIAAQSQKTLLEQACKDNSKAMLVKFFENWNKEIPAITDADLQSKDLMTRNAYTIFSQVYDPIHLSKLSGITVFDTTYANSKYAIVQNSLNLAILHVDTLRQQSFEMIDSVEKTTQINDFKPQLALENMKVVYLSDIYKSLLNEFLGTNGTGKEKQLQFIRQVVQVLPNTKEGVTTNPYVYCINFNRKQTMARVDFYLIDQKGTTYFINENNTWKMIWSGLSSK